LASRVLTKRLTCESVRPFHRWRLAHDVRESDVHPADLPQVTVTRFRLNAGQFLDVCRREVPERRRWPIAVRESGEVSDALDPAVRSLLTGRLHIGAEMFAPRAKYSVSDCQSPSRVPPARQTTRNATVPSVRCGA
jgi:hypothetical protein